jgi:hypothetical protein
VGSFSCSSALTSLNTMHLKHIYESARLKSHRVHSNRKPFKNIFLCFKALDKYEKAVKKTVQAGMQVFKTFLTCLGILVFKILFFLVTWRSRTSESRWNVQRKSTKMGGRHGFCLFGMFFSAENARGQRTIRCLEMLYNYCILSWSS